MTTAHDTRLIWCVLMLAWNINSGMKFRAWENTHLQSRRMYIVPACILFKTVICMDVKHVNWSIVELFLRNKRHFCNLIPTTVNIADCVLRTRIFPHLEKQSFIFIEQSTHSWRVLFPKTLTLCGSQLREINTWKLFSTLTQTFKAVFTNYKIHFLRNWFCGHLNRNGIERRRPDECLSTLRPPLARLGHSGNPLTGITMATDLWQVEPGPRQEDPTGVVWSGQTGGHLWYAWVRIPTEVSQQVDMGQSNKGTCFIWLIMITINWPSEGYVEN